jgi:hypothetical protein
MGVLNEKRCKAITNYTNRDIVIMSLELIKTKSQLEHFSLKTHIIATTNLEASHLIKNYCI